MNSDGKDGDIMVDGMRPDERKAEGKWYVSRYW